MHSRVSFDSEEDPKDMIAAAEAAGLSEICFTDHYDFNKAYKAEDICFTIEDYNKNYDSLPISRVKVRRGVEFGITRWNMSEIKKLTNARHIDFVIGSLHYVGEADPYVQTYWVNKSVHSAFEEYLSELYECLKLHDDFDVLGHLNYVCKSPHNPTHEPLLYKDFSDVADEILKLIVSKGRGIEVNTSGIEDFLPSREFVKRFRELGGEIITVGSDAHTASRVGANVRSALDMIGDVFGYVCTFEDRKPIFHKLK